MHHAVGPGEPEVIARRLERDRKNGPRSGFPAGCDAGMGDADRGCEHIAIVGGEATVRQIWHHRNQERRGFHHHRCERSDARC